MSGIGIFIPVGGGVVPVSQLIQEDDTLILWEDGGTILLEG